MGGEVAFRGIDRSVAPSVLSGSMLARVAAEPAIYFTTAPSRSFRDLAATLREALAGFAGLVNTPETRAMIEGIARHELEAARAELFAGIDPQHDE